MNSKTNSCPCCGNSLLRHARQGEIYWFCTSCWQEVPLLTLCTKPQLDALKAAIPAKPVVSA